MVSAAVAEIEQVPEPVKDSTPVKEFTVQPVDPAFATAYATEAPPRAEARMLGVSVPAVRSTVVFDGAHETIWGVFDGVIGADPFDQAPTPAETMAAVLNE